MMMSRTYLKIVRCSLERNRERNSTGLVTLQGMHMKETGMQGTGVQGTGVQGTGMQDRSAMVYILYDSALYDSVSSL